MKPFLWLTLFCAVRCLAMDITTLDGTTYREVKVTRIDVDGLVITHAGGAGKIEFLNLPEEVRKKYAYDPAKVEAAKKAVATGWQEMDQRLVFLTVQLSSVEASLAAVNRALVALGMQQAYRQRDITSARQSSENMDRNGGGPVPWSVFYGTTAEKFFYHPTDKNTSYHTQTILRQLPAADDVAPASGVPSRQGLPVPQRPPQWDYIYRANADAEKRAQEEVAQLGNNTEKIQARRRQLDGEQSALWSKIAFHAVAGRELLTKPLYFYDLKSADADSAESRQRLEAVRAVMDYLRNGNKLAAMVEDGVEADPVRCYSQLQKGLEAARSELQRRLMAQPLLAEDLTNKRTPLGKCVAVVKRMSEISANINDAYRLALDGDRAGDQGRKLTFRSQLQQSLMLCAEALLAGDECVTDLAREWKVQPAVQTTAAPVPAAVQSSLVVPVARPVETPPVKSRESTISATEAKQLADRVTRITQPEWDALKGIEVIVSADAKQKFATGLAIKDGEQYLVLPCVADRWNRHPQKWLDVDFCGHTSKPMRAGNGMPLLQLCYSIDNGPLLSLLGPSDLSGECQMKSNRGSIRVKILQISADTAASLPAPIPVAVVPQPNGQPGQPPATAPPSSPLGVSANPAPVAQSIVSGKHFENSLGMIFVPVPGTSVQFSIWDTRVKDFSVFVNDQANNGGYDYRNGIVPHIWIPDGGWGQRGWKYGWDNPGFAQTPEHPVVCVSWEDAKAFCAWLTAKERRKGQLSDQQSYRLPTDSEWSHAVGIGELEGAGTPKDKNRKVKDIYPWGTQWPPPKGAGNYGPQLHVDDYDYTSPVGSFPANRNGLYDMGGNVFQRCEDLFDPSQKSNRARTHRVMRGYGHGGDCAHADLLSSARCDVAPDYRDNYQGFRVVLAGGGESVP